MRVTLSDFGRNSSGGRGSGRLPGFDFSKSITRASAIASSPRARQLFHASAPASAAKILGEANARPDEAIDRAAMVAVSRVILNLDEFVTRD